jgi:hypothetical protein
MLSVYLQSVILGPLTKNEIKLNTVQINRNQNAAIGSNHIVWNVIQNSIILTNYIKI